jgi:hypothetical protein
MDRSLGALKYWESLCVSLSAGLKCGGSQMGTSFHRSVCGVINMQCAIRRWCGAKDLMQTDIRF